MLVSMAMFLMFLMININITRSTGDYVLGRTWLQLLLLSGCHTA